VQNYNMPNTITVMVNYNTAISETFKYYNYSIKNHNYNQKLAISENVNNQPHIVLIFLKLLL